MANAIDTINLVLDALVPPTTTTSSKINVVPVDPDLSTPFTASEGPVTVSNHREMFGLQFLIGKGVTLANIAYYFLDFIKLPLWPDRTPTIQVYEALGLALFRFGTEVTFGTPLEPNQANVKKYWLEGTLFPVPALHEKTSPLHLVADVEMLRSAAAAALAHRPEAELPADSLDSFNPFEVPSALLPPTNVIYDRKKILDDFLANSVNASDWAQRFRWNPYAAALPIIHLLSPLTELNTTALDPGEIADFVNMLFEPTTITDYELDQIARTSGGYAVLRAAFIATTGSANNSRSRMATALGGIAVTTDLNKAYLKKTTIEPPSNSNDKRTLKLTYHRYFLGRSVEMQWGTDYGWTGPAKSGSLRPKQYRETGGSAHTWPDKDLFEALKNVGGLSEIQLADRLFVIDKMMDIEGLADAIRSQDHALVSIGMQQFSFHIEDEGTVLLRRIRGLSEFWFDVFFRSAGFEVGAAPLRSMVNTVAISIGSPAVVTWNKHGLKPGNPITFSTTGVLPDGVTVGATFYVSTSGLTPNTFEFSASPGGAVVETSGTHNDGIHTCVALTDAISLSKLQGEYDKNKKLIPVKDLPLLGRPTPSPAAFNQLNEAAWLIKLAEDGKSHQWCVPGTVAPFQNKTGAVTISIGSPAIVTWISHGLGAGTKIFFSITSKSKTDAFPEGILKGTAYYVAQSGLTENTFEVARSAGGKAIDTTKAGQGTFACTAIMLRFPPVAGESNSFHSDSYRTLGLIEDTKTAGPQTEEFLARFAVAARLVPEVVHAQMELSVNRFHRLSNVQRKAWKDTFADAQLPNVTIQELFPSHAQVAAIYDIFINAPNIALPAARRAFDRAVAGWQEEHGVQISSLPADMDFRVRVLLAYLCERRWYPGRSKVWEEVDHSRNPPFLEKLETRNDPRPLRWIDSFNW